MKSKKTSNELAAYLDGYDLDAVPFAKFAKGQWTVPKPAGSIRPFQPVAQIPSDAQFAFTEEQVQTPRGLQVRRTANASLPEWVAPVALGGVVFLVAVGVWAEVRKTEMKVKAEVEKERIRSTERIALAAPAKRKTSRRK